MVAKNKIIFKNFFTQKKFARKYENKDCRNPSLDLSATYFSHFLLYSPLYFAANKNTFKK